MLSLKKSQSAPQARKVGFGGNLNCTKHDLEGGIARRRRAKIDFEVRKTRFTREDSPPQARKNWILRCTNTIYKGR